MKEEKLYLVNEHEVVEIKKHNDNSIDTLTSEGAHEFKNEHELLRYILGLIIHNDGQIGRGLNTIIDVIVNECVLLSKDGFNMEMDIEIFEDKNNVITWIKNKLNDLKD